jgi:death-on-curing protein
MIFSFEEVIAIHQVLIDEFGGATGIRDQSLLEAALFRPTQTFDRKELYPTPIEKAAAVLESVVVNHPFVDGNKRTGYVLMRMILLEAGLDINASQEEKYDLVMGVAKGDFNHSRIAQWISEKVK